MQNPNTPALTKKENMYTNLENVVIDSIRKYPTLYNVRESFSRSRLRVLDHLFMVIGNGYAWNKNGFMTFWHNNGADHRWTWSDSEYGWVDFGKTKYVKKEKKLIRRLPKQYAYFQHEFAPYPAFQTATVSKIPNNVKPDWRIGAMEIIQEYIKWYDNPDNFDSYMKGKNKSIIRSENLTLLEGWYNKLYLRGK